MKIGIMSIFLSVALFLVWAEGVDMPAGHKGLTLSCETCHTTDSWIEMRDPVPFDHKQTGFALEHQHRNVDCATCHKKGDFVTVRQDCQSCHRDVHRSENGSDCQRCHDSRSWIPSQEMDFHQTTRFPLVGVHNMVNCESCHVNLAKNEFVDLSTDCYSCHVKDFMAAKSPDHSAAKFNIQCEVCHPVSVPNWKPSTFDHNQTQFALTGAHANSDCASCHFNGVFAGTPQDCYTCHKLDYERVEIPNHVVSNFEKDCLSCHTEMAWTPSTFDHSQTGFPLTGAHVVVSCQHCHVDGVFAGTPQDCFACHQQDYEKVVDPNHVLGRFSVLCLDCHTETAWEPATFDHNQTRFALTGQHATVACASCHQNGVFQNTPMDCVSCHQADFNNARDPNHLLARFPQDCTLCHNANRWEPSTFNHRPYFPIYSGEHRGEWNTCADCHTQPTDFKVFSCITCHEHRKSKMDNEHDDVRNYVYNSQSCYRCHPDGRE